MQQTVLRCWRCHHHYSHHTSRGCCVTTHGRWDEDAHAFSESTRCVCEKYLGDEPQKAGMSNCPHEIQPDVNPNVCVHCRRVVPKHLES